MMTLQNCRHEIARRRLLKLGIVGTLMGFLGRYAHAQSTFPPQTSVPKNMSNKSTAAEIRELLSLEPHPTCGFVRETYRSAERIAPGGLPAPFADGRPLGSALYFMVTPERHVHLHRIRNDQLYHYYLGDPIELLMLRIDGTSEKVIV